MDDTPWMLMLLMLIALHSFFWVYFVQACAVTVIAFNCSALDVSTMVPVRYRSFHLQHT